jgi:hypothetical protein
MTALDTGGGWREGATSPAATPCLGGPAALGPEWQEARRPPSAGADRAD